MKGSFKLGTYAGIGVYLHWTFALLIVWVFVAYLGAGQTPAQAVAGVAFILALFGCVVLHEFGHALTARRYGIRTRDITLLPIGGVARLERIPEKPMQEFWVAIAGPAVNVVIAGALFAVLLGLSGVEQLFQVELLRGHFLARLLWVNLLLVAFNLLPAFPMDGGRVLRALLATRLGRPRATAIAAAIGQAMAILFALFGLVYSPMLIFIAVFVYLGARAEAAQVQTQSELAGLRVRDAMTTRFRTLEPQDSLGRAVAELRAGAQQDFPVTDQARVVGMLRRKDLVQALAEGPADVPVGQVMDGACGTARDTDDLLETLESMRERGCSSLPVLADRQIVGLLTVEGITEVLMLNAALSHPRRNRNGAPPPTHPPS